jgi:hypothetical protein
LMPPSLSKPAVDLSEVSGTSVGLSGKFQTDAQHPVT